MVRGRKSVLITDAAEDPERELRRREIRYVAMMLTRALCLIGAAVIVSVKPPLWGVWLAVCLVAMVLLPWFAVILANDRPAKSRAERRAHGHPHRRDLPADLSLPGPRDHEVIDGDPPRPQ